jgi:stage II sporulation protein D
MRHFGSLVRVVGGTRRGAGVNSMRRTLALASVLLFVAGSAAPARLLEATPGTAATFLVTGHGWGHGVGLSQYGAYGYAQHGVGWAKIVSHYFPGTTLGGAPVSRVRVLLASGVATLKIGSTADFTVKDGRGMVHELLGGTYALTPALKLKVDGEDKARALPAPLSFLPGDAPLTTARRYRGSIQVDLTGGKLRAINFVSLEHYLYGVVPSEMPYTWHPEALKAQAVVARSYALAVRKSGAFDLYPDTRSQVYLGVDHEQPSTNAAVDATAGKVVLYQGQVAKTFFFSTSGGRTASSADVWGTAVPYLVSVPDPYDSISPHHDWGPVVYTGAKLARALKLPGRVVDLKPSLNSSGRVESIAAVGTTSEVTIAAGDLRRRLGLRSTWFSVGVLSLSPPRTTVVFGGHARLNGVARGLGRVAVQQRSGGDWQPLGQVQVAKDGALTFVVKPASTTQYRLAAGKVSAAVVRVPVAPLVRFYATRTPNALRGYVRPLALAGSTVLIQRQSGAGWSTVARTSVDAEGIFLAELELTSGIYRARVAPGRGFVPGMTPALQVSTS